MPSDADVLGWRWRLTSPGPSILETVAFAETARASAMAMGRATGVRRFPDSFHRSGSDEHTHAYWLPEDEDHDGVIDNLLVYCDVGIADAWIANFAQLRFVHFRGRKIGLAPRWMGREASGALFGPSARWLSATPYVTPRHRLTKTGKTREDETRENQLLGELRDMRFSIPEAMAWHDHRWCEGGVLLACDFLTRRETGKPPPGDAEIAFLELTFNAPVMGPLAFGYGSHFGLGQMWPVS